MNIVIAVAVACAIFLSGPVYAARQESADGDPARFVEALGDSVVKILENPDLSHEQRIERYSRLFKTAFDLDSIGTFAIGRYRNTIADTKFTRFRDLFGQHLIHIYASKFANYSGEKFVVKGERKLPDGQTAVAAFIRGNSGTPPTNLTFKVASNGKSMKIHDVVINGVSLLVTKRQEVMSIMANGGIDHLIDKLQELDRKS